MSEFENDKYHSWVEPYFPYNGVHPVEADAAYCLLRECGVRITRDGQHQRMTPYRLAHYLNYWTRPPLEPRFTVFDNVNPKISQVIVVDPIDFWACCSHHMLPFFGKVYFGYVPEDKLVGLSMIPLVIKELCTRPWLQETMTEVLADWFTERLHPNGLGIVTIAMHTCQMLDLGGPPVPQMKFSSLRGSFFDNPATRDEFFRLSGL